MVNSWRILVVDDDKDVAKTTADFLARIDDKSGKEIRTVAEPSFEKALSTIREDNFDILVLDVRDQSMLYPEGSSGSENAELGKKVFQEIRSQKFLPIIFYTALPNLVTSLLNPPFVQIVSKGTRSETGILDDAEDILRDAEDHLRDAVKLVFDSGLPFLLQAIKRHIDARTRDFMVDFLEKNWPAIKDRELDIVHLLLRRLSVSLEGGVSALADALGYSEDSDADEGIHPTRFYVVPSTEDRRMGDLLHGPSVRTLDDDNDDSTSWYIVLTPSCDLVADRVKADQVVLAECLLPEKFPEYQNWMEKNTKPTKARLIKLLRSRPDNGQEDRYYYLPAAWQVPDLIVDFQRILYIDYAELEKYTKFASVDSPFAEALLSKFNRYIGRIGVPDLNYEVALDRMREATD